MSRAQVSVVIPTYNSGRLICDAVDSVLAQTMVPTQIIVVDDGSSDDTAERLQRYGSRITYQYQTNAGPSAARNRGVKLSGEPLIAFLDADDVWHPRKLEIQVGRMQLDPEMGLIATDNFEWPIIAFPDVPGDVQFLLEPITWDQLVVRTLILTSSVLVRRDIMEGVGEFDRTLCGPEDRDMFLRIAKVTKLAIIRTPLVGYRDSPGSLTKQAAVCERGMRLILHRLDKKGDWQGRWLLRRKSYSFMHHRCAAAQARAGKHLAAIKRTVQSLVWYPLPYKRQEVALRFERARRLAVNLLRLGRLKRPDPGPSAAQIEFDALEPLRTHLRGSLAS